MQHAKSLRRGLTIVDIVCRVSPCRKTSQGQTANIAPTNGRRTHSAKNRRNEQQANHPPRRPKGGAPTPQRTAATNSEPQTPRRPEGGAPTPQRTTETNSESQTPRRPTGGAKVQPLFLKVREGFGERAKTFFLVKKSFRSLPNSHNLNYKIEVSNFSGRVWRWYWILG